VLFRSGGSSSGGSKGGSGSKGGTTPSVTAGSTYTVKSGDTLSAIAKASGVKLSDIYAANKKFKQNPKYKGGNMIWSGTTVKIPTIKK
jgi:LysM repeat protein